MQSMAEGGSARESLAESPFHHAATRRGPLPPCQGGSSSIRDEAILAGDLQPSAQIARLRIAAGIDA